jgi:hypothetical protein
MNNLSQGRMQHAPVGLASYNQFISWRPVPLVGGKTDKVPCDQFGNDIDAHDRRHWLPFEAVCPRPWGLGFVLTEEDDLFCIDIDDAWNMMTGQWSQLAVDVMAMFPHAYTEVSYSGTGLHIIARGSRVLPVGHRTKRKGLKLEVYTRGRFIALTGHMAQGDASIDYGPQLLGLMHHFQIPLEPVKLEFDEGRDPRWLGPEDDDELLAMALAQRPTNAQMFGDKPTFRELWEFDAAALARKVPAITQRADGLPFDYSTVDASLMANLSYFTGRDQMRMVRLFERWKGFRREHYAGRNEYRLGRVLSVGCGNPNVMQRGPGERALQPASLTPPSPGGARPLCTSLLTLRNGAQIADTDHPPQQWLVDDMMPEGCHLLIGKPKKGKSWMSLQLAIAVATGTEFMGQECKQGRVLYLALEDTERRIKSRLRATCKALGIDYRAAGGQILFGTSADNIPTADKGLYEMIAQALDADPLIKLVIIDTLHKARPQPIKGEGIYAYDRRCVDPLTDILNTRPGRSMLIVHHATKNVPEDPYDMASGSMGLTGACDGGLFLAVNGTGQTVLYINCRDGEGSIELAIKLSDAHWENMGDADVAGLSDVRVKVIQAMQKYSFAVGPKEIADEIGEPAINVRKRLRSMAAANQVIKEAYGKYRLTPVAMQLGIAPSESVPKSTGQV